MVSETVTNPEILYDKTKIVSVGLNFALLHMLQIVIWVYG